MSDTLIRLKDICRGMLRLEIKPMLKISIESETNELGGIPVQDIRDLQPALFAAGYRRGTKVRITVEPLP